MIFPHAAFLAIPILFTLGQILIGGFCMRKQAAVSAVVTVDPIKPRKPLENFLFVISHPGEGGVQVAREEV